MNENELNNDDSKKTEKTTKQKINKNIKQDVWKRLSLLITNYKFYSLAIPMIFSFTMCVCVIDNLGKWRKIKQIII